MKKIFFLLSLLFSTVLNAQLPNVKRIGLVGQNYKFDNGLQVNDTLLPLGPIKVSAITAVGGATDSVLSRDPVTGFIELRPQGGGASEFSDLTDAYDLSTAALGTVPVWMGGTNLTPLQMFEDGFTISVDVATNAALSGTWIYDAPGIGGVGDNITRTTNGAIGNIDGVASPVGRTVLIKNFTGGNKFMNGPYVVTVAGSAGTQAKFTRMTNSDESTELENQVVIPALGTANKGLIFRQVTGNPTVGTSNIDYQTNTVSAPSTAPSAIKVNPAQALVTAGRVVVERLYEVTNSAYLVNANDRIRVKGATPDSYYTEASYLDEVNGEENRIIYLLTDALDQIVYRENSRGNQVWDIGFGLLFSFPWGNPNVRDNQIVSGCFLIWANDVNSYLYENTFGAGATISDGGFTSVQIGANVTVGAGGISMDANGAIAVGNTLGNGSGIHVKNKIQSCTIGDGCNIDDNGFVLIGCTFPSGMSFIADKSYTNVNFEKIIGGEVVYTSTAYRQLTAAEFKGSNGAPITLVAAPGSGYAVVVTSVLARLNFGSAPFGGLTNIFIQNLSNIGGAKYFFKLSPNQLGSSSSGMVYGYVDVADIATAKGVVVENDAVVFSIDTTNGAGDGTVDVYVTYKVIKL